MSSEPLLFGILIALSVLLLFIALWRQSASRDPVEARLKQYGVDRDLAATGDDETTRVQARRRWPLMTRLLAGFGLGPRLARDLTRAGLPLTAAEYAVITLGIMMLAVAAGTLRVGLLFGLVVGAMVVTLSFFYLSIRAGRRRREFTSQLPEVLTLLTGALRAGYGMTQAMEMMVDQLRPPSSEEFAWVVRAVELGMPAHRALGEMADRIGSDDLDLVVTAINVQTEMGGNLAQTLDTISETVRERIRLFRQIRVLTAQQRLTGYILTALPIFLAVMLAFNNPEYIRQLFAPGWVRLLPITALVMQFIGFLIIRRIVDIEV